MKKKGTYYVLRREEPSTEFEYFGDFETLKITVDYCNEFLRNEIPGKRRHVIIIKGLNLQVRYDKYEIKHVIVTENGKEYCEF